MAEHDIPILFEEKSQCFGCYACYNVCPRGAIDMTEDTEGFVYPSISEDKCVSCNLCVNVCQIKK